MSNITTITCPHILSKVAKDLLAVAAPNNHGVNGLVQTAAICKNFYDNHIDTFIVFKCDDSRPMYSNRQLHFRTVFYYGSYAELASILQSDLSEYGVVGKLFGHDNTLMVYKAILEDGNTRKTKVTTGVITVVPPDLLHSLFPNDFM